MLKTLIVLVWGDNVLVNKATGGYDLTSESKTLEALQNTFILIYRCKIYPFY